MSATSFQQISQFVDSNANLYIEKLRQVVAIASVSGDASYRPKVFEMGSWLVAEMERIGVIVEQRHPGKQMLEGQELDLPPVILGRYGSDPAKKTVLVYGHYDVQPALLSDGWNTDPWMLTEENGKLFGRGSTDDKAPVISWLLVIEAHQKLGLEMPVNLLMCFEGMEESGSEGLDDIIIKEANGFFKSADCVCISDNYWLGTKKPCLTYGLRGISYFALKVKGSGRGWFILAFNIQDLHSGSFGGTVHEPMTDLVILMSKLVAPNGKILVPGIYDDVAAVLPSEDAMYDTLDFTLADIHNATDSQNTIHSKEKDALMARWRFPSLSIHGIEGAFSAPGAKTVIPAKVIGKFSIRSVPNQSPDVIEKLVVDYVKSEFAKLGSKNSIECSAAHGAGKCWVADVTHWNFKCAAKAVKQVFGVEPDYTREGGSIPVTLTFQDALGKSVLLLPMGRADDGAHSTNEKIDRANYIEGIKLLSCYLHEIGCAIKIDEMPPRPVENPFCLVKKLIRMSWNPRNLYNNASKEAERDSNNLRKTVFQQRWQAKRELRAYHVPNITERQLLDRHFTAKIKLQHLSPKEQERVPPVQSLGFAELERRVDVVVFRSHFADSIFIARKLVVDGHVTVNGEKSPYPFRRLNDGDMISVDPAAVTTLVSTGDKAVAFDFKPHPYMGPWMFIPPYLEVNYPTCSTVLLRSPLPQPDCVEVPSPLPPSVHQLCFEWYSNIKRRKSAMKIRAPIVINGKTVRLKNKFDRMVRYDQNVERLVKLGKKVGRSRGQKVRYTKRKVNKIQGQ